MVTYQSRAELVDAYESLVKLEQKATQELQSDEPDLDKIESIIQRQSELMENIESSEQVDQELRSDPDSPVPELIRQFSELRQTNQEIFQEALEELDHRMEALEQSRTLMEHYMQGKRRSEEGSSQRIDHTV